MKAEHDAVAPVRADVSAAPVRWWIFAVVGAGAGAVSTLFFTVVHGLMISDIWFFWVPMVIAGIVTGAAIAWSYRVVASPQTLHGWLMYNTTYVVMLVLLALVSAVIFEPSTRFASLLGIAGLDIADRLIGRALPLTVAFTILSAALITVRFGRNWRHFGPVLAATTLVMALLGLNVSILGLIDFPLSAAYVVGEFVFLIVAIVGVYTGLVAVMLRSRPTRGSE